MKQERIELNTRFVQALAKLEAEGEVVKHSQDTDKISYKELAVIMGSGDADLPTSRLADYKSGKRLVGYPEAIRFADAFGLDKNWLILGEPEKVPITAWSFTGDGQDCHIIKSGSAMLSQLTVNGKDIRFADDDGAAEYFHHLFSAIGYKTTIQTVQYGKA